ncbi:MAG: tetratricopeptide repeat protein [Anaerolineales bacterium]|nr:tetratricopeptide repeat protein [Anaerolineales bacterium]
MIGKTLPFRLLIFLILAAVLASACSPEALATPTEIEIEIGPPEDTPGVSTPIPTPTLRPTSTPTLEPTVGPTIEPSPTNTLDPYGELIFQGLELRKSGDYNQALTRLSEAIRMERENPRAYVERARVYLDQGMFDEAITDLNFAVNYDPNYAEAYNARGVAWALKEQMTQAFKDLEQAITLDPALASAYSNRAQIYLAQNDFDNAIADFSKVVELHPDDPETYYNRGQAYLVAIQYMNEEETVLQYAGLCIADFNQALALYPENGASYANRGQCHFLNGDLESAYADLSKAIELDPNNFVARLLRSSFYPDIGTMQEALADAQYVLDNAKDSELIEQARLTLQEVPKLPTLTPAP